MKLENALNGIPSGLRSQLLREFQGILENHKLRQWLPSELHGGRFCEVVYTILLSEHDGIKRSSSSKPANFVKACRDLENNKHVHRSFQILIPRLLPVIYEVRNNRGVGHVGGDVDSNATDAAFVVSSAKWIMAELVRAFHSLSLHEAERVVDNLTSPNMPLIWEKDGIKRLVKPGMSLASQIVILCSASTEPTYVNDLVSWTEVNNKSYFKKLLKKMHKERLIEYHENLANVELLPLGHQSVKELIQDEIQLA